MDKTFAYVHLNARIEPKWRDDSYRKPLQQKITEMGWGEVTGAGTMLSADNEIEGCGIDLALNDPATTAPLICEFLESYGLPLGSSLIIEGDNGQETIMPVGTLEGLAIHLNQAELPDEAWENADMDHVIDELFRLLGDTGLIEGLEKGPAGTSFYAYGFSAGEMLHAISGFVRTYPLCQRAQFEIIA